MRILIVSVLGVSAALGQKFEVASVKPAHPDAPRNYFAVRGGPGTSDPGRITYTAVLLKRLVEAAYGLRTFEVVAPDWMETDRYDVTAKVPEGATRADLKPMLQDLLAERFQLETHRETRETAVYNLVQGKNGLKIRNPKIPEASHAGFNYQFLPGRTVLNAKGLAIGSLPGLMSQVLGRPVFDKTGIAGTYDFVLEWSTENAPAADSQAPPLTTAIPEQLGLKLDATKTEIEMLIVDKARKTPIEN